MTEASKPIWFITGCSTGFGRELAKLILERGGSAVVTARNVAQVQDLTAGAGKRALALALDVTKQDQIDATVAAALAHFGRIDVLVNNAGYGYQSTVEEGVEADIRAQFDANVFGLFAMTRAVLPGMRAQRSGHIINISSVAGLIGFAASGYYAASKHAVEGFSDSLAAETAALGIKVTCVEPGPFRTLWAGPSLKQRQTAIADYEQTAGARMRTASDNSGKQPGDPVRAGEAMIDLVALPNPPRHLVLGAIGYGNVTKKLAERLKEVEDYRAVSVGTDYPATAG